MSKKSEQIRTEHPEVQESASKAESKEYTLVIHKQEGPGGSDDVTVGVNGRVWQIKREHEVTVPAGVYHVLMDAVEKRYRMNEKGDDFEESDVNRFPVSVRAAR
jgi:hypothetical protein